MTPSELTSSALDLPPEDRLELARRLVESVITPASMDELVTEGVQRIEDVLSGKVPGLSEDEFRRALG